MFKAEQFRQFIHMELDQFLEAEHDPGAALRVLRCPGDLGSPGIGHCQIEMVRTGKLDPGLNLASGWIVDIAGPGAE